MALKTLENVKKIDGFNVMREEDREQFRDSDGEIDWDAMDEFRKDYPIYITDSKNMISFRIQDGPVKENGVNGCQVQTMLVAAKMILEKLNVNFPCRENSITITRLDEAILWQKKRTSDREDRGVEGLNKE